MKVWCPGGAEPFSLLPGRWLESRNQTCAGSIPNLAAGAGGDGQGSVRALIGARTQAWLPEGEQGVQRQENVPEEGPEDKVCVQERAQYIQESTGGEEWCLERCQVRATWTGPGGCDKDLGLYPGRRVEGCGKALLRGGEGVGQRLTMILSLNRLLAAVWGVTEGTQGEAESQSPS